MTWGKEEKEANEWEGNVKMLSVQNSAKMHQNIPFPRKSKTFLGENKSTPK